VAGHTSGWEADSERRCSPSHDAQRMVSVVQTRLCDYVMPACHKNERKYSTMSVMGSLTPSSAAFISVPQPSQTTRQWGQRRMSLRSMSFLSAFLGHSGSGHGASTKRQSSLIWAARRCLWHVNSQPLGRLRHSTMSSSTIWEIMSERKREG
jgi:hypothetical protein